jgi:hypothetical protein
MLSTSDLEGMRETMLDSLPDVCSISRYDLVSDGAGGHTQDVADPELVECRVSPLRLTRSSMNAEIVEVERVVTQNLWLITMPHGVDIRADDRIGHNGMAGDPVARWFEVVEVLSPRSFDLSARASCKLVNAGAG